jgi:hypothetical protein
MCNIFRRIRHHGHHRCWCMGRGDSGHGDYQQRTRAGAGPIIHHKRDYEVFGLSYWESLSRIIADSAFGAGFPWVIRANMG